jgi:hypothetical protein
MQPYQFLDQYHELPVEDSRIGVSVRLNLTRYESGWSAKGVEEATAVLDGVARKCCKLKRGNAELPATFTIEHDERVDRSEQFYCAGIRRAFGGRGSPDEVRDALRLAVLAGRPMPGGPKKYAEEKFGQDCNAFVANYLGVSPMIGIRGYAKGYRANEYGLGRDLTDCQSLLPLPTREDVPSLRSGDVIVTYGSIDSKRHGWRWRHIALLEQIDLHGMVGKEWKATVRIAEWGTAGGVATHRATATKTLITDILAWKPPAGEMATLHKELSKEMKDKQLVGFVGSDPSGAPAIRFFLDASPLEYIWHRGLHIANGYLGH